MSAIPATPAFEDETRAASPAAGLHLALTKNHAPRDDVPEKTTTCNFSSDEEPVGSTTPSNAEAPAPKPKRRKPRWPKHVRDAIKAGAAAASRVRSPYSPDPEAEKSTGRGWENDSTAGAEPRTAETDATGDSAGKFIDDDWNLSHGRGSNTSKPAAIMSRAGGLEVRVDRPGGAAAEASRAREFGPKARWTCRVQRSPPKRGDETSRDRLPPHLRYAPRLRSPDDDDDDGGSEPSLAPSSDDDDDDGWGPTVGLARKKHHSFNAVATAGAIAAAHERAALEAAHDALEALDDSEEEGGKEDFPAPRAEEEKERVTDARATSTERVARERTRERRRSRSPIRQIRVAARAKTLSPAPRRGASPQPSRFSRGGRVTRGPQRWSPPRDRWHDRDARRRPSRSRSRSRSPSPRRRHPSSWSPSRRRRDREDDWNPAGERNAFPYASHRDPYASPPRASPIERTCASDPRKATSSGLLQPRREEPYSTPPPRSESFPLSRWSTRTFSTVEAAAVQQTTGQPMKFKSKLCEDWTRHGRCPAGDVCGYAHGASQLRDSVVPCFDPTNESHVRAHTYRACVHTALCHVSRRCVWVDEFEDVFRYVWNTDLELPVRFGGVPYSMEEYLARFMSPHTVRVFELDGRAAVTLATPTFDEARRRDDDDDDAFGVRRGVRGDGRENERPAAADDWSSDRDDRYDRSNNLRRRDGDFFSADEERPRKKPRAIVVDRRDAWFIDTNGNNGLIIGARGKTIKAMESQSGANIDANSKEHIVEIFGRADAVRSARLMIEHKLGEFHKKFIGAATMRDLLNARRQQADRSTGARQSPHRQSPAADRGEDSRDSVTEPCATPIDNEQSPSRQERQSPMKPPAADHGCDACGLRFADEKELRAHKLTKGHLSSIRAAAGFDSPKTLVEHKRPKCELCDVTCTSNVNLQAHYAGRKHKEMLASREAEDRKTKAEEWKKKNSR